jgi:hypothetical protein
MAVPKKPAKKAKTPNASKSPGKVTKSEAAYGKKYAKLVATARQTIDVKGGTTTRAQAAAIKDARAQLKATRKEAVKSGYGSLDKKKNKAGGTSSHGIYKDLTGKKRPQKKPVGSKKPAGSVGPNKPNTKKPKKPAGAKGPGGGQPSLPIYDALDRAASGALQKTPTPPRPAAVRPSVTRPSATRPVAPTPRVVRPKPLKSKVVKPKTVNPRAAARRTIKPPKPRGYKAP